MSKITENNDMRPEYDFSDAVNHALRLLTQLADDEVKRNLINAPGSGA